MLILNLVCCLMAFHPTIDGARQILPNIEAEAPYWLGVSVPPPDSVNLVISQGDWDIVLDAFYGTDQYLKYIDSSDPIYFYEDGEYAGQIVPEPMTIMLLLGGVLCLKQ